PWTRGEHDGPRSLALGVRDEVDQLLDAADECGLEVVPVPHPAPDPLPRSGDVGLLAMRPAHRLPHAFLPVHALRNHRPRRDAEAARLHRLPDVDEGMTHDPRVLAAWAAADGFGDPGLLGAGHQVVDEHSEATPLPGLKLLDDACEIVDAAEVFDH